MGLDMYAHAINEELLEGQGEIDISMSGVYRNACRALGMNVGTEAEYNAMTDDQKHAFAAEVNAYRTKAEQEGMIADLDYWRKFNNLHGWMERLYREKGGTQTFNCVAIRLTPGDLDKLEADAKAKTNLDPQKGFFFGGQEPLGEEDVECILNFVKNARQAISAGKAVLYDSWW